MRKSVKRGLGFGITSGIITTLGLMVGLFSGTHSRLAVLGGIITIAIADSFSDAFGIHVSEESVGESNKDVWKSTFSTFLFKFFTALIFITPIFIFSNLNVAVLFNVLFGLILLAIFSIFVAKKNKENVGRVIFEHLGIAVLVIIITYFVGEFVYILL